MQNVAFDLEKYYPSVPPEPYAHGEVQTLLIIFIIKTYEKILKIFNKYLRLKMLNQNYVLIQNSNLRIVILV